METIGAKALEDFADNIKVPIAPFPYTRPNFLTELWGPLREQAFKRVRFALWKKPCTAGFLRGPSGLLCFFPGTDILQGIHPCLAQLLRLRGSITLMYQEVAP